jgi:hypothetical protein
MPDGAEVVQEHVQKEAANGLFRHERYDLGFDVVRYP